MIDAAALGAALAIAAAPGPYGEGPWILTCNMAGPNESQTGPNAQRTFRIGRRLFQEWRPETKQFGRNLCQSLSCVGAPDKLQGVISSPTLSLTITLDLANGQASWRTLGASGLRVTSGPCTVRPDEAAPKSAPAAPHGGATGPSSSNVRARSLG
jgi:hypothetical protein